MKDITSKKINIKNLSFYHSNDIININGLDFENIGTHFIYYFGYKIRDSTSPLSVISHKMKRHIKNYNGFKYLTLFPCNEKDKDASKNICRIKLNILLII